MSSALLFLSIVPAPYHVASIELGSPSVAGSALLSEFYSAGLRDDEYVVLANPTSVPVNLRNWSISDGEGILRFERDCELVPGGKFIATMNSSSYESAFGRRADWSPSNPLSADLIAIEGRFRLADAGDSLSLRGPDGYERDFVAYGNCSERSLGWLGPAIPALRRGEVAVRASFDGHLCDTNSAADWCWFREFRYGYTEFPHIQLSLPAGALTAFVSPDCSLATVLEVISNAEKSIRICTYEIDSEPICRALARSLDQGVSVKLLVDGAPAGGISERESAALSVLERAGADVRLLNGNLSTDDVKHVGALHCKYMVVDSFESVILSENFVEDGLPLDTVCGNRGWGIAVKSGELASFLESMFEEDSRASRPDVRDWGLDRRFDAGAVMKDNVKPNHTVAALPQMSSISESRITVAVSPDGSLSRPFILDWIDTATLIAAQQFQVDLLWKDRLGAERTNPIVSALGDCLSQGGDVQVVLDSSWFNAEKNTAVAQYLEAVVPGAGVERAKLLDGGSPLSLLHNKGAVMDGRVSMVSSNNWVHASFAENRELAAFIESDEIARYFRRAFEFDWEPDDTSPDASAGEDVSVRPGETVRLNASDSVDDRAIVHWLWDLNSDGTYEGDAEAFEFRAEKAGKIKVDLIVEDGWGNRAWDSITVTVAAANVTGAGTGRMPTLFVLASASGGLLLGCAIARARTRIASKVNQLKPD